MQTRKFSFSGRRSVNVTQESFVQFQPLSGETTLPLLAQPATPGVDLAAWLVERREQVDGLLDRHGGILFRQFELRSGADLERLTTTLAGSLLGYEYRSTPRTEVGEKVFTSTEYPPDQAIPLHNEMSYARSWPLKIWFLCVTPAAYQGETPIADSRRVYQQIPERIRRVFAEKRVRYVRNYGGGIDLPWQEVFQTSERGVVEAFCRHADIELEWKGKDGLKTWQTCQAVARHPRTGEWVWFNQAHLYHVSSGTSDDGAALLAAFGEDNLPRTAYYGDGSPIEPEALAAIRAAYDRETVLFAWQPGDLLMLDNMLVAHGRRPFRGERRILVAMAEPYTEAPTTP